MILAHRIAQLIEAGRKSTKKIKITGLKHNNKEKEMHENKQYSEYMYLKIGE